MAKKKNAPESLKTDEKGVGIPKNNWEYPGTGTGSVTTEKLFWTYADLSERTGIPESTLRKWVCFGRLTPPSFFKFGRRVRFDPEKVMARLRQIGAEHVS